MIPFQESFAAHVHRTLDAHHGFTGPTYIEELLKQVIIPGRLDALGTQYTWFLTALDPEGKDQNGQYSALLALADYLARLFVLGQDHQIASAGALVMGHALVALTHAQRDTTIDPVQAGYETIVAWVAEHDGYFNGEGPRRFGTFPKATETDGRRVVAILPEPLKELAKTANFDLEEVLHGLLDRQLLLPGEIDRLGRKTTVGGERVRAYWIVLPDADDPEGGGVPPDGPHSGLQPGPGNTPQFHGVTADCPAVPPVPVSNTHPQSSPTPEHAGGETNAPEGVSPWDDRDTGTDRFFEGDIEEDTGTYGPYYDRPGNCPGTRPGGTLPPGAIHPAVPPRRRRLGFGCRHSIPLSAAVLGPDRRARLTQSLQ